MPRLDRIRRTVLPLHELSGHALRLGDPRLSEVLQVLRTSFIGFVVVSHGESTHFASENFTGFFFVCSS